MDLEPRKVAELAILENLENEVECKKILTDAYKAGLFTDREVNKIVEDIKAYNDQFKGRSDAELEERERINKALLKALGPSVSFVLSKLIHQYPNRILVDDWFIPDVKDIEKSTRLSSSQVEAIIIILRDKDLIETKIEKKIKKRIMRINFYNVTAIYTNNSDDL